MSERKHMKGNYRQEIFRHLDGIVTAPVMYNLAQKGILQGLSTSENRSLIQLTEQFSANEGYLNVALHTLCSQAWAEQTIIDNGADVHYRLTDAGAKALDLVTWYSPSVEWLLQASDENKDLLSHTSFVYWQKAVQHFKSLTIAPGDIVAERIHKHIEGLLLGPMIVHLGMGGMFHKYFMEASFSAGEFHKDPINFKILLDFLVHLDWFTARNDTYSFTEKGLFFAKRASAYGVTVSYLPTFRQLKELIFGNPLLLKTATAGVKELHVDREMNVWGSGGAHATYFKKIDEVIIHLFNQPISEQPKGILDMGCGNGAFLKHLFEVIEQRTLRGTLLDEHPLFLVGADFNETALKVTRANLIQADIWAKVVWGDIGRPDLLAADLKENYAIDLSDLLNVRTFLDHNRIWEQPKETNTSRQSKATGAYAHEGNRINNNLVEDSLVEHLKKWKPFIKRFGLLMIELHTIDPALAALHIGETPVTAYNATHGFSDQYILELEVFQQLAKEAGLQSDPAYHSRYPNTDWATVSINLLKGIA